jgi:hypothetical protein
MPALTNHCAQLAPHPTQLLGLREASGQATKHPRRFVRWWAALFVTLLLAACGGGAATGGAPATYTVSVTVTGLRSSYNGLTLHNNGGDDLRVYGDGMSSPSASFKTALATGSAYAVTVASQPTGPDQTCTVSNGSGTVGSSNVTNVAIDCPYPTPYTVGGTVTGLAGGGVGLQYAADNLSFRMGEQVNANGAFAFLPSSTSAITGTNYVISIFGQPTNPAQICVVNNGTGTVAGADVSKIGRAHV